MDDLCKHDLPAGTCADCAPRKPRMAADGPVITAEYYSRCPCGERITPGDAITPDPDGDGWIHAECA